MTWNLDSRLRIQIQMFSRSLNWGEELQSRPNSSSLNKFSMGYHTKALVLALFYLLAVSTLLTTAANVIDAKKGLRKVLNEKTVESVGKETNDQDIPSFEDEKYYGHGGRGRYGHGGRGGYGHGGYNHGGYGHGGYNHGGYGHGGRGGYGHGRRGCPHC